MKKLFNKNESLFMAFGIAARIVYFVINLFIGGNNIDEVMLSLNSVSLSERVTDISGLKLPIYFDTWLYGGQSPFPTYLSAISIKFFGLNLFAVRFPALIFSILGFVFFCKFIDEIKLNKEHKLAMYGLASICPWMVFSAVYVLDCNYLGHVLAIALFCLAKAVNTRKTKYYVVSMALFALGFYCYIASVLIIPVLLLAFYLVLVVKKRIELKNVIVSIVVIFVFSAPFILFGLVNIGLIPEFKALGFTVQKMQNYTRYDNMLFADSGFFGIILKALRNFFISFVDLGFVDISDFCQGPNIFLFANLFGGVFMAFGILNYVYAAFGRNKEFSFVQKIFALAFFAAIASFFTIVDNENYVDVFYRYGVLSYMLLYFEGFGIVSLFKLLKISNLKKALVVYLALSFMIFNFEFFGRYRVQVKKISDVTYGDSLFDSFDYLKDNNYDKVVIYMDNNLYFTRVSVFCRYYYYDTMDFNNIRDEILERDINGEDSVQCTDSGIIRFETEYDNSVSNEACFIISDNDISLVNENIYSVKDFGFWNVCEKK